MPASASAASAASNGSSGGEATTSSSCRPTCTTSRRAARDDRRGRWTMPASQSVVLQNDHIYGNLAEYFAAAAKRYPGPLHRPRPGRGGRSPTATTRWRGSSEQVARARHARALLHDDRPLPQRLPHAVRRSRLRCVLEGGGAARSCRCSGCIRAKSPVGNYEDEMRHLARIIERHPTLRHVLVHGVPTALYADERRRRALAAEIVDGCSTAAGSGPRSSIRSRGAGGMTTPIARALSHVRQLYRPLRTGAADVGLGHAECRALLHLPAGLRLSLERRRFPRRRPRGGAIFRDNALALFKPGGAERRSVSPPAAGCARSRPAPRRTGLPPSPSSPPRWSPSRWRRSSTRCGAARGSGAPPSMIDARLGLGRHDRRLVRARTPPCGRG